MSEPSGWLLKYQDDRRRSTREKPSSGARGETGTFAQPRGGWKTGWQFLKTLKTEFSCDPAICFWVYILKNCQQGLEEVSVHPCSEQHYS